MKRSYVLPGLAILGVVIAVIAVIDTNRRVAVPAPAVQPAQAPFSSFVAGSGITEIGRGNIAIATTVPGVVEEIYVKVGALVTSGDPLFKIDDRDLQARLDVELAKINEARAAVDKPRHRLDSINRLQHLDSEVVSRQAISDLRDDAQAAQATVDSATAIAGQTKVDIERSVVRAPSAGRILQINIRAGEYADAKVLATPLLLMGDDTRMFLRVDIDESDAWRVKPKASAEAIVRGNPRLRTPLRFEYIEPYVTPKTSLTGQSTERSDVRVLQVIYSFDRSAIPVYVGQQMDVFIQAAPVAKPSGRSP
ncbi:MAG TPA: efflux RND transporter periplasmic adaptor subunit [Luteimonas sp.]|nr:efflux RND transporter periplasmic adaptor subunit [Luteimonas sp.]